MTTSKFNFFGEIDNHSLVSFEEFLYNLEESIIEVELNINSYGGECFIAFGIIDLMKKYKNISFISNILGLAASSSSLIALSCDKVRMSELGTMMIHSAHSPNQYEEETLKGIEVANERQKQIISKRISNIALLDSLIKSSNWICAKDALELGLIDELIYDKDVPYVNIETQSDDSLNEIEKVSNGIEPLETGIEKDSNISNNTTPLFTEGNFNMEERLKEVEEVLEGIKSECGIPCVEKEDKTDEVKAETEIEVESDPKLDLITLVEKLLERVEALEKRLAETESVVDEGISEEAIAARVKSIYARAASIPSKVKSVTKDNKSIIDAYKNFIVG